MTKLKLNTEITTLSAMKQFAVTQELKEFYEEQIQFKLKELEELK